MATDEIRTAAKGSQNEMDQSVLNQDIHEEKENGDRTTVDADGVEEALWIFLL